RPDHHRSYIRILPKPAIKLQFRAAGQENTGVKLNDGGEFAGHDVELVVLAFFRAQLALVAFPGQLGDTRLRLPVRLPADELARRFLVERRAYRCQKSFQQLGHWWSWSWWKDRIGRSKGDFSQGRRQAADHLDHAAVFPEGC